MGRLRLGVVALCATALACASAQPVLYPNAKLERVGRATADADIADCRSRAKQAGVAGSDAGRQAGEVAADTAGRAGAGAAAGAAGGAIRGSAGTGAAIGAASAAAWGLVRGGMRALFGRRNPDPIERRFVERCLADRGYDVIGWR